MLKRSVIFNNYPRRRYWVDFESTGLVLHQIALWDCFGDEF